MFNVNKSLRSLKDLDRDDLLDYIGLQSKAGPVEAILPTMAAFGVGILIGAGLGLLLAPKAGSELREDLRNRIQGGPDQMAGSFPSTAVSPERAPKAY